VTAVRQRAEADAPALGTTTGNDPLARVARWIILFLLVAAPLAFGSVIPLAFVPLQLLAAAAGLLSWWRPAAEHGPRATAPPGARLVLAFLAVILIQLVPLPPLLLRLVSPGTYAFHERLALLPVTAWSAISVDPAHTSRGLVFALTFALLYSAAVRESRWRHWRRHVVSAIVATGFFMTIIGLVQAASAARGNSPVFGPYFNHNHFANYIVMAAPLSLALLAESLAEVASSWRARGWLVFADPPASRALVQLAVTLTLLVGQLSTGSRGGIAALLAALFLLALVLRRSRATALILVLLLVATAWFVDPRPVLDTLKTRPFSQDRWPFWKDALRAVPHFPLFGSGFAAYATISPYYQTAWRDALVPEVENEYIQVLIDTGLVGACAIGGLLTMLASSALRVSRRSVLGAGLFAALAGCGLHNVIEFGWQIPANAATFIVLGGLAVGEGSSRRQARAVVGGRQP
jgi:O-antigen ligase